LELSYDSASAWLELADVELKVAEAPRTDSGSPIARVHDTVMKRNRWVAGDILEITGAKKA